MKDNDAQKQLERFIEKFDVKHQVLIRAVRQALKRRFRGAFELVYDNYNFFVIGYGPTQRTSDCIVSLTAASNGVGLCFIQGARLPDPNGILLGSGKQTRYIRLKSSEALRMPEVEALLGAAVSQAKTPFQPGGSGRLIIRSISAKQRPRRKN